MSESVADDRATALGCGAGGHVIEEIARHAGHLDIARELLDGRSRLAQKRSAVGRVGLEPTTGGL